MKQGEKAGCAEADRIKYRNEEGLKHSHLEDRAGWN